MDVDAPGAGNGKASEIRMDETTETTIEHPPCHQLEEDMMISIVGSQKSTNYGSWKRIDFTEDSGSAGSCTPADMENKSTIDRCLVRPTEYAAASNHKVRVVGKDSFVGALPELVFVVMLNEGLRKTQENHVLDESYVQNWIRCPSHGVAQLGFSPRDWCGTTDPRARRRLRERNPMARPKPR